MLTRRGWAVLGGSVAIAVGGRVLGVLELFVLAAGGLSLAAIALATVLVGRPHIELSRRLVPPRLPAGDTARVELLARNRGRGRTAPLTVRDPFAPRRPASTSGTRLARFHVAPLPPGGSQEGVYRLSPERRGLFQVGPLEVRRRDPFGLAAATVHTVAPVDLVVYPRVDPIRPLPRGTGSDPRTTVDRPAAVALAGDEFYGLRPYEIGDDLRRVHWASTARLDELVIRQLEHPRQGRSTVVLDTSPTGHDEASFEAAVSAAASILNACSQRGDVVRLMTTAGVDTGFGTGQSHLEAAMEQLAVVEPGARSGTEAPLSALTSGHSGSLAVLTTASGHELRTRGSSLPGGTSLVLVVFDGRPPPGVRPAPDVPRFPQLARVVHVAPGTRFADAWNRAMSDAGVEAGWAR